MTVKYEDEIHDYLKGYEGLTTVQISQATGRTKSRVWTALTQLEMKGLVEQKGPLWWIINDPE